MSLPVAAVAALGAVACNGGAVAWPRPVCAKDWLASPSALRRFAPLLRALPRALPPAIAAAVNVTVTVAVNAAQSGSFGGERL